MKSYPVVELLGDGIGPELSTAVHRLADEALPFRIEWLPFDLSVENRREKGKDLYKPIVKAIENTRAALKHPTQTVDESPNQILRRKLRLHVIHRPVQTIPGVPSNFTQELDLDIVRVATGGTYDDPGRMIGEEAAVSLRIIERDPCRQAASFAFDLAKKTKKTVTSSSKHTIQRATDGLFESVVREVAQRYAGVSHRTELFDALLAKVVLRPQDFKVVLVLNEYGDFLSDMACGLVGSLGIGASGNYGFDGQGRIRVALFDAAHGTAPDIAGQGKVNPTAIFLAFALLLYQVGEIKTASAIKNSCLDLLTEGVRPADLGGNCTTSEFADEVVRKARQRIADPDWASKTVRLHRSRQRV